MDKFLDSEIDYSQLKKERYRQMLLKLQIKL